MIALLIFLKRRTNDTREDMEIIITHLPIYIGLVIVYLGSVFLSLISGKYTYLIISDIM